MPHIVMQIGTLTDDILVKSSFAAAEKVFSVNGQFKVTPTAFHSFVMTENFFVLVEVCVLL